MTDPSTIWLASRSPRRSLMLREAGIDVLVEPSDLDDSKLRRGRVTPPEWVMALAWFKARRVAETIVGRLASGGERPCGLILAADTLCVHGEILLGQPSDDAEARAMLEMLRNATHRTMTGICLLDPVSGRRFLACDITSVHMGDVTDSEIGEYLESGHWRGKAGAYNLSERLAAGWPIQCRGDPATVMGLPMRKLPAWIERFRKILT